MEKTQSKKVEVLVKAIEEEEIIIHDTKEINIKGEEIKTTQYFLNVKNQDTNSENQETQYVTVEECDETHNQFVTVEVDESNPILIEDKDVILWNELCRICANSSDRFIPIFTGEGLEHNLCNKIHTYLPVRVSESDTLPLQLCYSCAATLLAWHEMSKGCLDAQQRLIDLQTKFQLKEQYYNESTMEEETVLEVETTANEESQIQDEPADTEQEIQVVDLNDTDSSRPSQNFTYMCGLCDKLYEQEFELVQHLKIYHEDAMDRRKRYNPLRYECNVCRKSYTHKANLIKHVKCHMDELPGEDGIVEKSKVFVNQVLLFKCDICNHMLSHRRGFLRHIRVHANERPVVCELCGKSFRIEDDLRRHVDDVHKKIKRYACDICGNSFAAKATRDAHRRIHTGEKPFPCKICNKSFRSINLLGIHKRTHTDYRPHKCSYCEKAFRDRQKLSIHESIHTGVRPHACDVCGKLFAAKGELTRHRSIHFEDKPFLCSECGMNFRLTRYLRTHFKQHHKENAEELLNALEINR